MIAYTHYRFDGRVRLEAESLVKWGYEVIFLVPKAKATSATYTLEGVTVKELNVTKYNGKNKLSYLLSYITFLVLAFASCTRLFFQSRVRVIHVHNMPDVLVFAAIIPRIAGCKLVLDLHDTVPETYEAKFGKISRVVLGFLRLEERVCCAVAHRIICVNHVQRESVIKRGVRGDKISTVITMPEFAYQAPSREAPRADVAFRLVNHGTMSKRLGNDLIIEAAAKLVREIPGFELHLIGGGDNLDQLAPMSKSLGIENCVHFHDRVPWNELGKKLSVMDAGIVANRVNVATELMLPSKLIDYVVLGIPAIVPRLKAIEYYFSPEMVSYFEAEDVDSMVAATVLLYRDKARREQQPEKARKFLDENRWDDPKSGLRGLYNNLFSRTVRKLSPLNSDAADSKTW
jgi:glycosyltransferase involved in cell wall biosynthesis